MKKIKIIMTLLLLVLTIIITIPGAYAYDLYVIPSKANYIITVNTQYQPTISNQGDITLNDVEFNTFNQMFAFLTVEYPGEIGVIQVPLRHDSNFTIFNSNNTILYFYENVRMITIVYDMYVNQSSTKITYLLYSSNGTIITTFNYTWNATTQTYYHLMTYEHDDEYRTGFNNGYQQGYDDSIIQNYQPNYDLGYNSGYNEGYSIGKLEGYSAWEDIMQGFFGPFNILNYELLPGFRIGYVFAFFMIIGVLGFLIGKRKA